MDDLVVLVADKNMQFVFRAALTRHHALGIRQVSFEVIVHSGRDGGVRTSGAAILALYRNRFKHAVLCLDYEGSGTDQPDAISLEAELDDFLSTTWLNEAKAIVIQPELERWMWGSEAVLKQAISWPKSEGLRESVSDNGFTLDDQNKPTRPKEALEHVFRLAHTPRSSASYEAIAQRISLKRCQDASFQRLRTQLQLWFP